MRTLRNRKELGHAGFTLIETAVAMSLFAMIAAFGYTILLNTTSIFGKSYAKVEGIIDQKLGERVLLKDIRLSAPSMNSIKLLDDNGASFFDYDADKTSAFYKSQPSIARSLTLKLDGKKVFYVLLSDEVRGKALFTDVITFFELGPTPIAMELPSPLIYQGLDHNNYLTVNAPDYINEKKLILVDSSSSMTSTKSHSGAFFIGLPSVGPMVDLKKVILPDNIFSYAIMEENNEEYIPNNFRDYLINLPASGANGASVRIRGVKLIKYQLECKNGSCDLYRSDFSTLDSALENKRVILRGCKSIKFSREDISYNTFKIDVIKEDVK